MPEQKQDITAPKGRGPGAYGTPTADQGSRVPVHPTETPGGLQVESQVLVV